MARSASPTASTSSSSSEAGDFDFMKEPESFRPKTPPPTVVPYARRKFGGQGLMNGSDEIHVGLVSGHPLWGHILYPAALALSRFLEIHSSTLLHSSSTSKGKGKRMIELGAGGGLPGLVSSLESLDSKVIISDFPDPSLISNIAQNISINKCDSKRTKARGFTWGSNTKELLDAFDDDDVDEELGEEEKKFDLVLLSDLVFNHSQHSALLDSCSSLLSHRSTSMTKSAHDSIIVKPSIDLSPIDFSAPAVLCFFSHHRPTEKLIKADLGILSMAEEKGWKVTKVWEDPNAGPAFPEDAGDLSIRSTVHGYAFTRASV